MPTIVIALLTVAVVIGAIAFVARYLHQLRSGAQAPGADRHVWWIPGNGRHGGA